MTNPLTALPPRVRQGFYVIAAFVGLFLGACQVYGAEELGPLDVSKALEVLGYLSVALGLTAAANVPSYQDVADGEVPPPDERGAVDVAQALLVVLLVLVILVVLSRFVR